MAKKLKERAEQVQDRTQGLNRRFMGEPGTYAHTLCNELVNTGWTSFHRDQYGNVGCYKKSPTDQKYQIAASTKWGDENALLIFRVRDQGRAGTNLNTVPDKVLDELSDYLEEAEGVMNKIKSHKDRDKKE